MSGLCHETGRKVEEALARLQLREEETAQAAATRIHEINLIYI